MNDYCSFTPNPPASPKTRSKKKLPFLIIPLFLAFIAITITIFLLLKPATLRPATITYDPSLTTAEKSFLEQIFPDSSALTSDLTISATTTSAPPTSETDFLYDVLVPVADFYDPRSTITSAEAAALESSPSETTRLISISDLTSAQKLLAIDNDYYLDTFNSGALFRVFHLETTDSATPLALLEANQKSFPTSETTLSLAQTGVTALSRAMQSKLKSTGDGAYFAEKIKDFLSSKDLTHISNEVSFVEGCNISSGATTLCADPLMLDTITAIGTDIVELTGNHNIDYGSDPAIDTIDQYESLSIETFGGGKNATAAAIPLNINQKSTKITLLGYNYSTGGYTTDDTPGANFYTEEKAKSDIATAKQNGDFVIVDVQYYECYSYPEEGEEMPACDAPISGQTEFFRNLIDLGADIVIGTQAHQPQTYEQYKNGVIYYGLGNLFFDQTYWPGTTRSLILTHYFVNGTHLQTRLTPTVYDENYQTALMSESDSIAFLTRLNEAR